jgi:hypothetical protein
MSDPVRCPHCGQLMPPRHRAGVWLPARKAAIFDYVAHYPGVTAAGIAYHVFGDDSRIQVVRVHVNQINELLAGTDTRISGNTHGTRGEYHVIRRQAHGRHP